MTTLSDTRYVSVVFDHPLRQSFTYRVPSDWNSTPIPGARVRANFGNRKLLGFVVPHAPDLDYDQTKVKDLLEVLDTEPVLLPEVLQLLEWVADYYCCSLGEACFAAFPFGESMHLVQQVTLRLGGEIESLLDQCSARAAKQKTALKVLAQMGEEVTPALLSREAGVSSGVIDTLVKSGLIVRQYRIHAPELSAGEHLYAYAPPVLNTDQQHAVEAIAHAGNSAHPKPILLFGVTGSGKTEVFLQAIEGVLAKQKTALVLVPEISLTPQTAARYRSRFPGQVVVLHSGLSDGERFNAWKQIREGLVSVVVGTRSAIFAPLARLGLIIVDEEHDSSYKQTDPAPRYHARDVAVMRGYRLGCPVVLGSATPATESYANYTKGKYTMVALPNRAVTHSLPQVRVVDLRSRSPKEFVLSRELQKALTDRLAKGQQSILFLNRRGYATMVVCMNCGYVVQCRHCSVAMVLHNESRRLLCHHCDWEKEEPTTCPACKKDWIRPRGFGTQQVELVVKKLFPDARVMRMDLDTTRQRGAHDRILSSFRQGNLDILIGTQMIAKGLDMPGVTLVGVINADCTLTVPDFRAAERTFTLLTQVAGRAGRGEHQGEVFVQTFSPRHYAIQAALTHDTATFYAKELEYRRLIGFPPYQRMMTIRLDARSKDKVRRAAEHLGAALRQTVALPECEGVRLIGPSESPLYKVRDRFRWIAALTSADATRLRTVIETPAVAEVLSARSGDVRVALDVDPLTML